MKLSFSTRGWGDLSWEQLLDEALVKTYNLKGITHDMPEESLLNKNVAVYGASGSMKTRAYCLNRILQAANGPEGKRESLIICDPKSELYERTSR